MEYTQIKKILEAALLSANDPLEIKELCRLFDGHISSTKIEELVKELQLDYIKSGIELLKLSTGYRFRTKSEIQTYLDKLSPTRKAKYSRAVIETLTIIAYHGPITRGEIEEIRGISINSNIIQLLSDRNWINIVGHKKVPGKPELLAVTNTFLSDLGLGSIEDLPPLPNIDENLIVNNNLDLIEKHEQEKDDVKLSNF